MPTHTLFHSMSTKTFFPFQPNTKGTMRASNTNYDEHLQPSTPTHLKREKKYLICILIIYTDHSICIFVFNIGIMQY